LDVALPLGAAQSLFKLPYPDLQSGGGPAFLAQDLGFQRYNSEVWPMPRL
jgi:hypothetical protein